MPDSTSAPLAVLSPPDKVPPEPPVVTRIQHLPFGELTWENFERLCHRLTALDGDVEHCARYGRQGDAQEGIDIFARQMDGRYHCLQAKRHQTFDGAKLRKAVDLFISGSWRARAGRFTIAIQASLRSPAVQEEIERQAARLNEYGIVFAALDGEDLTDRLRGQPLLVDDFFGRSWATALLGEEAASRLGARLDGASFARIRAQLARVYSAQFQSVDPGSFGSISDQDGRPALSLLERFVKPDMLLRENAQLVEHGELAEAEGKRSTNSEMDSTLPPMVDGNRPAEVPTSSRMRRMSLAEWFGNSQRMVVLGDAGCGKSTLLRVIALDLLHGQTHLPELAPRWGEHIPVYIPFARWTSQVARNGGPLGIKEIIKRSLEQLVTTSITDLLDRALDDRRILLLIDGLDEWGSEQAARTTLSVLVTTAEAHDVPVIVCGRPRGLNRIGSLPATWKRGTIAPLSTIQQKVIAQRWFQRHASRSSKGTGLSEINLRTEGFMAELARDANLGSLAVVPLLLVGLVTLALRGQILPRTKSDIYDQLVRVLLEVHPDRRATASGDTEPRFRYATDPDQRRAAIARLAFAVREQTGGAGMQLSSARSILRTYLSSPRGFDIAEAEAALVTGEILSVNSETQGLLVEKAPGEVGFVHASFEEFLGAEHIGGWPFDEIEAFVQARAGEGRWRNVITNLLGYIQRRDEFDRLIRIVEADDPDEIASLNRHALLGDVAFSAAVRSPTNARRLALATMDRVECEDWLPARREALTSVLKGLSDPMIRADIEQRLRRWLPARNSYSRAALIKVFGTWQPTSPLQNLLLRAMHDENLHVKRAAAAAYAKAFAPSPMACKALIDRLASTRDLSSAAAMLESLAHGWPNVPEAAPLFEEAWKSHSGDLCLVGILGLVATGKATDEARDAVLRGQSWFSDVSYEYRELAVTMLIKYWPGDETLINGALRKSLHRADSIWEHEAAARYLLESPADHPEVQAWVLTELAANFPFNLLHDLHIWSQVGRFAASDPRIRAAANTYWCKPESLRLNAYRLPDYVVNIADPPVATALVEMLCEAKHRWDRHWAIKSLISGWGRDHPAVSSAIDMIAETADSEIHDLVSFLPDIMSDMGAARERLIRIGSHTDVRRDLLAVGLSRCGCDSSDNEAVAAIMAVPYILHGDSYSLGSVLHGFGAHPTVKALALECIQESDAPFAPIAANYANDPEFSTMLFDVAMPLSVDLRTQIVEVAAIGAAGTALEAVLGHAMVESDPDLRARMVIANLRNLPKEATTATRDALLSEAAAVGNHYEAARAAALAGLVTIGALDRLAKLEENGKPIALVTRRFNEGIPSVERLICERFAEFEDVFGSSLGERFESIGIGSQLADILSVAPGASHASRAAFLAIAERGKMPLTSRALRALAAERPNSDLLLKRCWDALDSRSYGNDHAVHNAEIGLILRNHFPGNLDVRRRLVEQYKKAVSTISAIPLAVFAPDAKELPYPVNYDELGREFGDWTVALHVAACRADSTTFCSLLEKMVTRRWRSKFDSSQLSNLAVEERLQHDSELESLMTSKIENGKNPSVSGSFARYLAAGGKLSLEGRGRVTDLLKEFSRSQSLPIAGYDAIADQWRAARATLLDAMLTGLEVA